MSFFNTLHKIQTKPERTRKKILAISVAVIMAFIIFLWLNALKYSRDRSGPDNQTTPNPFSVFKETILQGFQGLKKL